jgi:hypothetical protein
MDLHGVQFIIAHTVFSDFTRRCLITVLNIVDFSASMFMSLPATDCLIAPHDRDPWPLTPSRVWPLLATTRYCRLAVTVRVTLRLVTYRQSGHLGAKPLKTRDQSSFGKKQVDTYGHTPCVTFSLTRGWVCLL